MSNVLFDLLVLLTVLVPAPRNLPEERGYRAQSAEEFQKTFNELHPEGWRLKRIKGYEHDGSSRFDCEWHKPADPPQFRCHHGIDRDAYESWAAQMKSAGYSEILKSTWKVGGMDRFWAVWELK